MFAESIDIQDRIDTLRDLRRRVIALQELAEVDHQGFVQPGKEYFFFRLPTEPLKEKDPVSITPSCTAWMSLASTHILGARLDKLKIETERAEIQSSIKQACKDVFSEPWNTGKLPENNPFTASVVARGISFLVHYGIVDADFATTLKRTREIEEKDRPPIKLHNLTLKQIVQHFLSEPSTLLQLKPFPASPTIAYWLVDAAKKTALIFDEEPLKKLASWAAIEFRRLFSVYSMQDASTMDPINLAMAACLCSAIREIAAPSEALRNILQQSLFPSTRELLAGVQAFFNTQNKYGVWEKYFPIFHYPASGPNYCWHFEVLEAVIAEFPSTLSDGETVEKIKHSVEWLNHNRQTFEGHGKKFSGWNGGGDVVAVRQNLPESWPTCVAHVFLSKLRRELDIQLKTLVLDKYTDRVQHFHRSDKEWLRYMDSTFKDPTSIPLTRASVKAMVKEEILNPVPAHFGPSSTLEKRRSAVLFGPPGTAKTSLCKAVAQYLGWPFLELSPSDFLGGGLDGIYTKVNEVFDDLSDLWGAVVLFDEMDALVRNRDSIEEVKRTGDSKAGATTSTQSDRQLDVTETLLTTSMLPKLAKLHEAARLVYFMATNFIGSFDGAIIRSGRFDLLIHLGPPSTEEKLLGAAVWFRHDRFDTAEVQKDAFEKAIAVLKKAIEAEPWREQFGRFTFGEVGKFFDSIRISANRDNTSQAIVDTGIEAIRKQIADWSGAGQKITLWEFVESRENGTERITSLELRRFEKEAKRVSIQ